MKLSQRNKVWVDMQSTSFGALQLDAIRTREDREYGGLTISKSSRRMGEGNSL